MRIAPRTLLSGMAFRTDRRRARAGFEELRELSTAAGDQRSLAIGMTGLVTAELISACWREAARLAEELIRLLESIGDPQLTVALSHAAMLAKSEIGAMVEVLRLAQQVIDLAGGDTTKGNLIFAAPVTAAIAMRGVARYSLGIPGWRNDFSQTLATARAVGLYKRVGVIWFITVVASTDGVLLPDAAALRDTAETLAMAEQFGEDLGLVIVRTMRGITLVYQDGPERKVGFNLLAEIREASVQEGFSNPNVVPVVNIHIAREKARLGNLDEAIDLARSVVDDLFASGGVIWIAPAAAVLVESLLRRGSAADFREARAAIDRLAAIPTDPGFVLHEIWLLRLRALLAKACGDDDSYQEFAGSYRKMATDLGFEGHIAWAEAMP